MLGVLGGLGLGKIIAGTVGVAALTAGVSTCSKNMSGENDKKYYRDQIKELTKDNKKLVEEKHAMELKIVRKQVSLGEKEMANIKSEWKKLDRKRKLRCEKECK